MSNPPTQHAIRLADSWSAFPLGQEKHVIHWHSWGQEAFQAALDLNRPVLLSIGYSTNPWCRRMKAEVFTDPGVVNVLNHRFICITVDRDERPDIDRVYQTALQALTQDAAGWPLTAFLSPDDRVPFFGGTYFPATGTDTLPGFAEVLDRIANYYAAGRATIREQNLRLKALLQRVSTPSGIGGGAQPQQLLDAARTQIEAQFDNAHGGFGGAPKFPQPGLPNRLLRYWAASQTETAPDLKALYMATLTLTRMAESAIHDVVRGGFFRHTTDTAFAYPTCEKTLADNAELLAVYAQAAIATGDPLFASTSHAIAEWMLRDLLRSDGFFYAGEIGTQGELGIDTYAWSPAELHAALDKPTWQIFEARYGLTVNDGREPARRLLHAARSIENVSQQTALGQSAVETALDQGFLVLRSRRQACPPAYSVSLRACDQALAIKSLMLSGRLLGREDYIDAADRCLQAIRAQFVYESAKSAPPVLDDLAFLLDALLESLQTRWRDSELRWALDLVDQLQRDFLDDRDGSLYWTAADGEKLLFRPALSADEALPAGSAVAVRALYRFGNLLGNPALITMAERMVAAVMPALHRHPAAHATWLDLLEEASRSTDWLIIRGPESAVHRWQRELARIYAPARMVVAIPNGTPCHLISTDRIPESTESVAYRYRGMSAEPAITDFSQLIRVLRDGVELS
jgi:uncharacterized protein YyaL (SSP411 family)